MRWPYVKPEKKEFVSDGGNLYSSSPQDQQVIVGSVPPDERRRLAGPVPGRERGYLTGISSAGAAEYRTLALKLTPRRSSPNTSS